VEVQPQLSSAVAAREDIALLQFRTASGVLAHINTNWLTPFKARDVQVATRRKYVMADLLTRQVTECFGFQPDGAYSMRHLPVGHAEPLRAEIAAFIAAVRSGTTPAVTGEEGVASLEIAMRCLRPAHAEAPRQGPRRGPGWPLFVTPDESAAALCADTVRRCGRATPAARRARGCRDRARARALSVHHGAGGRRARAKACGVLRRAPCARLRQRHRCAAARAHGQ